MMKNPKQPSTLIDIERGEAPYSPPELLVLPHEHQLCWNVFCSKFIYEEMWRDFGKVVFPSVFTKAAGRLLLVTDFISYQSLPSFIKRNALFGAPIISLTAGLTQGSYEFIKARCFGDKKSTCSNLMTSGTAFAKTFVKFFMVYMSWAISTGVSYETELFDFSQGLPAFLLIGASTAVGLLLSTLITDNSSLAKKMVTRAFLEGFVWSYVEHFEIYKHIENRTTGDLVDVATVSATVSFAFFIAGLLHAIIQMIYHKEKSKKLTENESNAVKKLLIAFENHAIDRTKSTPLLKEKYFNGTELSALLDGLSDNVNGNPFILDAFKKYFKSVVAYKMTQDNKTLKDIRDDVHLLQLINERRETISPCFMRNIAKTVRIIEQSDYEAASLAYQKSKKTIEDMYTHGTEYVSPFLPVAMGSIVLISWYLIYRIFGDLIADYTKNNITENDTGVNSIKLLSTWLASLLIAGFVYFLFSEKIKIITRPVSTCCDKISNIASHAKDNTGHALTRCRGTLWSSSEQQAPKKPGKEEVDPELAEKEVIKPKATEESLLLDPKRKKTNCCII